MTQTPGEDQGQPEEPGYWEQQARAQQQGWGSQPPPGAPYGQPPFPGYGYGYAPPPKHPEASAALAWGLVALIGGMACYLPFLVAPVAWAKGRRVVREIDASPVPQAGRSEAQTGMVLGIIGTVLLLLGLLSIVGLVALGLSGVFDDTAPSNV